MRIIISPAKKMRLDCDTLAPKSLPQFIEQAETLYSILQHLSHEELKKLWKCNDQIAMQNFERLATQDLRTQLTPAILAYDGIQYQHMAPNVFTTEEFAYVQEHLRILSGLYGILRPMDGVVPYRLEMQAKLKTSKGNDLYSYWNNTICDALCAETDCIINLASKEYSVCVSKHLKPDTQFITCIFGEKVGGKIIEKGTMCKMARGEMVRYLAEIRAEDEQALKGFSRLGFIFSPEHSNDNTYVFVRQAN